ncbi:hypothetical protein FOL47_000486, partial [Perkinsus chesapeaki]
DSLRFIPFLGWSWACADYPFLTRQWEKDKKSLLKSFEGLRQYSSSYLLTIFAEGTRMTTAKLRKSQEFAKSKGWNVLKNVLLPKTKGFTASVNSLGDQLDCIFDATLASPPGLEPTLGSVITGRPSELHVLLERIPISSLPLEDDAKLDKWLRGRWSVKDDNITKFLSNGSAGFPGFPRVDTFKRRIFPRGGFLVMMIAKQVHLGRGLCTVATVPKIQSMEEILSHFNSNSDMTAAGLEEALKGLGRGVNREESGMMIQDTRFRRLLEKVGSQTSELDARSLGKMCSALSALPVSSTPEIMEVCQKITAAAFKKREEFKPTALASLAFGLASRGSRDPNLIEMIKEDTLAQIEDFSPSELCLILEAQRRWGVHDRDLTENAIERLTDEIDRPQFVYVICGRAVELETAARAPSFHRFTVIDAVNTLKMLSGLGLARGLLLRRLSSLVHDQLPQFSSSQLVIILKSLAKLRFLSTMQIEGILLSLGDIDESSLKTPKQVSDVLFALTSSEYHMQDELRDNLIEHFRKLREVHGRIQLKALVDMAWSLSAMSTESDLLLLNVAQEIYTSPAPRNRDILGKMIEVSNEVSGKVQVPDSWRTAFENAQRMEIERSEKSRLHFELLDALQTLKGSRGLESRLHIVRNYRIGDYVVDFFDDATRLVIELDTLNRPTPLFLKHRHLRSHHNCKTIAIDYWTWRRRNRTAEDQTVFLRTLVKEAIDIN